MKKLISIISIICLVMAFSACSTNKYLGVWQNGNTTLQITADSLFFDEYIDSTIMVLNEGDGYSYSIVGEMVKYENDFTFAEMLFDRLNDSTLVIHYANENTPYIYHKIDANQIKQEYRKIIP